MKQLGLRLLRVVMVAFLTYLLLSVVYLILIICTASILSGISANPISWEILTALPLNANRVWLVFTTLSQVQLIGLTINSVHLPSDVVGSGYLFSEVFSPESTPLAAFMTRAISQILMINFGLALVVIGLKRGQTNRLAGYFWPRMTLVTGIWTVLITVLFFLTIPLSPPVLEAMGVGFLISPFVIGQNQAYREVLSGIVPLVIRGTLIAFGFTFCLLVWVFRSVRKNFFTANKVKINCSALKSCVVAGFLVLIIFYSSQSGDNRGRIKDGVQRSSPLVNSNPTAPNTVESPPVNEVDPTPLPILFEVKERIPNRPYAVFIGEPPPRTVAITNTAGGLNLLIDGQISELRGVHYYFGDSLRETPERREFVLRQDLSLIQQSGFNTVTGWEEQGFDSVFLKITREFNLSVIHPISLHPGGSYPKEWNPLAEGDFLDPVFRSQVKETIRRKIKAGRKDPSLVLWNIGADEPLEKMSNYYHRPVEQVQAAADLIVESAAMVPVIDPFHPTIISEPQDWYLPHYRLALNKWPKDVSDYRRFFIYGANFYGHPKAMTTDVVRVLKAVTENPGVLFAVMESSPFGLEIKDQARARVKIANEVSTLSPISNAYVFNPAEDPLNRGTPDLTQAIITGLAMLDLDRNDKNGSLAALAENKGKKFFQTFLLFSRANLRLGWSAIPLAPPHLVSGGIEQNFLAVKPDNQLVAYRWLYQTPDGSLNGPENISRLRFQTEEGEKIVDGPFFRAFLDLGGVDKFGLPVSDLYEITEQGKKLSRQDFSFGWSLVMEQP